MYKKLKINAKKLTEPKFKRIFVVLHIALYILLTHKTYCLLYRLSKLAIENKLLVYTAIIRLVWLYGIQMWGTACNTNIERVQITIRNIGTNYECTVASS